MVAVSLKKKKGKFNLNNLVDKGRRSEENVALFRNLLTALGLSGELAEPVVEWILPNGPDAYYLSLPRPYRAAHAQIVQVDELYRIRGFDAATVQRLRPYVTALPQGARLNVNTANERVLAAAFGSSEKIAGLLAERRKKPFENAQALQQRHAQENLVAVIPAGALDVKSDWFSVLVRVQQDDVLLGSEALVKREEISKGGMATVVWRRPVY